MDLGFRYGSISGKEFPFVTTGPVCSRYRVTTTRYETIIEVKMKKEIIFAMFVGLFMAAGPLSNAVAGGYVDYECQGCTPGYWKQERHLDSWNEYSPNDIFNEVFDVHVEQLYGVTLLDALSLHNCGGGDANKECALARHAVAALLNATNYGVHYKYSPWAVKDIVQNAFYNGGVEYAKNKLAEANEMYCPLN